MTPKFCASCGAVLQEGQRFCSACGAVIAAGAIASGGEAAQAQTPPLAQPQQPLPDLVQQPVVSQPVPVQPPQQPVPQPAYAQPPATTQQPSAPAYPQPPAPQPQQPLPEPMQQPVTSQSVAPQPTPVQSPQQPVPQPAYAQPPAPTQQPSAPVYPQPPVPQQAPAQVPQPPAPKGKATGGKGRGNKMLLGLIALVVLAGIAYFAASFMLGGIADQDQITMGKDPIPTIKAVVGKRNITSSITNLSGGVLTTTMIYKLDNKTPNQANDDISAYIVRLVDKEKFISLIEMTASNKYNGGYKVQFAKESVDAGQIIVCTIDFAESGYTLEFKKSEGTLTLKAPTEPLVTIEEATVASTAPPPVPTPQQPTPAGTQPTSTASAPTLPAGTTQPTSAANLPAVSTQPTSAPTTPSSSVPISTLPRPTQPSTTNSVTGQPWVGLWRLESLAEIVIFHFKADGTCWVWIMDKGDNIPMTITGTYIYADGSITLTNRSTGGEATSEPMVMEFESLGDTAFIDDYIFDLIPPEHEAAVIANPQAVYPPGSDGPTPTQPPSTLQGEPNPRIVPVTGWIRNDYDDYFEYDILDPAKDTATMTFTEYVMDSEEKAANLVNTFRMLLADRYDSNDAVPEWYITEVGELDVNGLIALEFKSIYTYDYDAGNVIITFEFAQWDIFVQQGTYVCYIRCNASQEQWDLVLDDYKAMLASFTLR